jgi:hypothetical protein
VTLVEQWDRIVPEVRVTRILVPFYVAVVLLVAIRAAMTPAWNFDVVGYVAAAVSWSESDPRKIHDRTYQELKHAAPPRAYQDITASSSYRRALSERAEYLATQIPFYTNKPGYVLLLTVFAKLNLGLAKATYSISVAAYIAFCALALWWLRSIDRSAWMIMISLCFAVAPPITRIAGYSTPDMLSATVLGFAAFEIIARQRYPLGFALLVFSAIIRPDNIIFSGALIIWIAWRSEQERKNRRALACIALAALLLVYVGVGFLANAYSLGVLMKHTFVEKLYEPGSMSNSIGFGEYLTALIQGIEGKGTLEPSVMPIFILLTILALRQLAAREPQPLSDHAAQVLLLCWTTVLLHFLAFPLLADRFFLHVYLVVTVVVASVLAPVSRRSHSPSELTA